jgi:hypothetical protein
MRITALLPIESRIIEIGARCGRLADRLMAAGYSRYLAVAPDERRRDALLRSFPTLTGCVTHCGASRVVRQNNADVLVLNGASALQLARFRAVRHTRYVALKLSATPVCWFAIGLGLIHWVLGRLAWPQVVHCGDTPDAPRLLVFRVRRPRPHGGARQFIPHRLGVDGFLRLLQARGVRHAVLRWFDTLPQMKPGEDLDLLVDDADLEAVRAMLDDGPGIQPIDLYSVTGLPGADFRGMPYYPPYLAEELLDRAIVHQGLCRVPGPREHFLSLAYHALYHKGGESGIVRRGRQGRRRRADHDYPGILRQLAERLGSDVPITLEDLDAYLDAQGWRPPHDMLVRHSCRNRWIRSLVPHPKQRCAAEDRLAVFLIREEALRRGGAERAAKLLEERGFRIIITRLFDDRTATMIARSVRGGNWGRGPWPISGGPPVAAIVVYDPVPLTVSRAQRRRFPFLANARLLCKERIRDAFNEGVPENQHCNVVHSSDNGREAMDYLRIVAPDIVDEVVAGIDAAQPHLHQPAA